MADYPDLIPAEPLNIGTNRPKIKVGRFELEEAAPLPGTPQAQPIAEPSIMSQIGSGLARGWNFTAPIRAIPGQVAGKAGELAGDMALGFMNLPITLGIDRTHPKLTRETFLPPAEQMQPIIANALFGDEGPSNVNPFHVTRGTPITPEWQDKISHFLARGAKEVITPENVGISALTGGAAEAGKLAAPLSKEAINMALRALGIGFGAEAGGQALDRFSQGDIEGGLIDTGLSGLLLRASSVPERGTPPVGPIPKSEPLQLPWKGYPTPDAPQAPKPLPSMGNVYVAPGYEFTRSGAAVPAGTLPKGEAQPTIAPEGAKIGRYRKVEGKWMDSQTSKGVSAEASSALEKNWAQKNPPQERHAGLGNIPPDVYKEWAERMMKLMELKAQHEDQPLVAQAAGNKLVFDMIDKPDFMEVAGQPPVIPADAAPFMTEETTLMQPGPMQVAPQPPSYGKWAKQIMSLLQKGVQADDPTVGAAIFEAGRDLARAHPEYMEHASQRGPEVTFNAGVPLDPGREKGRYLPPLSASDYRWYKNMIEIMRERQQEASDTEATGPEQVGGSVRMRAIASLLKQHMEDHPDYQHPPGSQMGDLPQRNAGLGPLWDPQAYQMYKDMLEKFQATKSQYSDIGSEYDVRRLSKYDEKIAELKEKYPEFENIPRQPYIPPSQLKLNAGIPLEERTKDAIRELRPDSLYAAPPPRDLQKVGQEIRQGTTPESAARQGQEQVRHAGAPIDPDDLRVAVKIKGELRMGEPGDQHRDVIERYGANERDIPHESPDRGYVSVKDPTTFLSRLEAKDRSGLTGTAHDGGLDSMDLPGGARARALREMGLTEEDLDKPASEEPSLESQLDLLNAAGIEEPSPEASRKFRNFTRSHFKAFEDGKKARAQGQTLADNPYIEGSHQERAWNRGFNEGTQERHAGVPFEEIRRLFRGTKEGDELGIKWFSTSKELAESYGAKAPKPEDVRGKVFDAKQSPDRNEVFEVVQDANPDVPMRTIREADPRYFEDARVVEELKRRGYKGMQTYFKGEPVVGMFDKPGIRPTINPRSGEGGFVFFPAKLIEDTVRKIRNFTPYTDLRKTITGRFEGAETIARVNAEQLANRVRVGLRTSKGLGEGVKHMKDEIKTRQTHRELTNIVLTGTGDPTLRPYADQMVNLVNRQMVDEDAAGVKLPNLKTWTRDEIAKQRFNASKTDMTDMFQRRIFEGQVGMLKSQWLGGLGSFTAFDGKSVMVPLVRGPGRTRVAPPGYEEVIIDNVRKAVHEDYASLVRKLNGPSWFRALDIGGFKVGEAALEAEALVKHGLLAFDTFHMMRVLWRDAMLQGKTIAGRISVPSIPRYMRGKSLLEYDRPTLKRLVQNGDIAPDVETWVNSNRATAELLMKEGLNVGRITEGLYSTVIHNTPFLRESIGRYNKWLFEKLSRGAMLQSALIEFERIKKDNPSLSDVQVARRVARDINTDFGNLQRQSFIKSEGTRDAAFMLFLAPQWFESMVTREVKGTGQLAKGLVTGKMGTLGKAVGAGVLTAFIANQLLNKSTRGQFTWENEEENRKLSAWVPDYTGEGGGFWIDPLPEVTGTVMNYMINKDKGPIESVVDVFKNKMSPWARAGYIEAVRTDYAGRKMGEAEVNKEALKALRPFPIFASGALSDIPGAKQRQAVSSLGVRLEPYGRKEGLGKLSIDERIAEAKQKISTREESYERRERASMLSSIQTIDRGRQALAAMSKADQGFIKSRNLLAPGYENTVMLEGVRVPLTSSEERRLKEIVVKNYSDAMTETIRPSIDNFDKEDQKKFFNNVMTVAREQAREQMIQEMMQTSDSMVESNRLRRYKTPALSPR